MMRQITIMRAKVEHNWKVAFHIRQSFQQKPRYLFVQHPMPRGKSGRGAVALAAVLAGKVDAGARAGGTTLVVLSGGNTDAAAFARVLASAD